MTLGTPGDCSIDRNFGFSRARKREILIKTNLDGERCLGRFLVEKNIRGKGIGGGGRGGQLFSRGKGMEGTLVKSPYGLMDLSMLYSVDDSRLAGDGDGDGDGKKKSGDGDLIVKGGLEVLGKFSKVALANRYLGKIDLRTAESVLGGDFTEKHSKDEVFSGEITNTSQSP